MTQREYYCGIEQDCCQATVLDCRENGGGYDILTDRTVIYPEGGGQPSDTGYIGESRISHAREAEGDIWHLGDKPLPIGSNVSIRIDMARRMDHSRQHTGEHMLSGLASKLFGAKNVGFHMAEDYSTLDLDTFLNREQLMELERAANRAVMDNMDVTYRFVDAEELENIPLRKQAKGLSGEVRIVYIGDVDSCTCCGTHCLKTGEVGPVRITASMRYKGGIRLWFACGMRAVEFSMAQGHSVEALARRFSVAAEDVLSAVERQGEELASLKRSLNSRTDALLSLRAEALLAGAEPVGKIRLILLDEPDYGMNELKQLADKLVSPGGAVAVLFGRSGESLCYQLAASQGIKLSMREACSAVNAAVGGKGGGREAFAQGSAKACPGGFQETLEQLKRYMAAALRE